MARTPRRPQPDVALATARRPKTKLQATLRPAVRRCVLVVLITCSASIGLGAVPAPASASAQGDAVARPLPPVLPPSAATQVAALLALDRALAGGAKLAAEIEKAHVVVTAGDPAAPRLRVTLVHPSAAPRGAFRVGTVALVGTPGPATPADLADLRARLTAAHGALGWVVPTLSPKPPPVDLRPARAAVRRAMDRASARLARMDRAGALAALRAVTPPTTPEPLLSYAIALYTAGDHAGAKAQVAGLPTDVSPSVRAAAAFVRGELGSAAVLLAIWPKSRPDCAAWHGAHSLHQLGQARLAMTLAHAVRVATPTCRRGWIEELQALSDLPPTPAAEATASAALARMPDDVEVLDAAATLSRRHRDFARAIVRYERLGASEPPRPSVLGHLSNVIMHSGRRRSTELARYQARLDANPNDDVARFMVGVLLHYADEYARSNAAFAPLIGRRDGEDRLWVYMAMNDFNLGKTQAALDVLNRIARKPRPDPDVYYCRAEITRDSDRAAAAADLRLYLAGSNHSDKAHAFKEARVRRMIAALERCQKTNPAICEGEWEHPRKQREAAALKRALIWAAAALAALIAAAVFWRRRRARRT